MQSGQKWRSGCGDKRSGCQKGKHETREEFERRLDRTAQQLPQEFIEKSIGEMPRRVERLYNAKGGLFEEGGKRRHAR